MKLTLVFHCMGEPGNVTWRTWEWDLEKPGNGACGEPGNKTWQGSECNCIHLQVYAHFFYFQIMTLLTTDDGSWCPVLTNHST